MKCKLKIDIYSVVGFVLACLALSGCTRRDLEMRPGYGYLKINLLWQNSSVPEVTTYYFYNSRGDEAIVAEGTSAGFEGVLPSETYHVVISNKDMVGASYLTNGSHDSDVIAAGEVLYRAAPRYIGNVESVYGTGLGEVTVPSSDLPVVVNASPRSYVRYITFMLKGDALENVTALEVEVSGIIHTVKAFTGEYATTETSFIRAEASRKTAEADFSALVSVFGFIGTNEVKAKVTFSGQDDVTTLPRDITDDLAALPDEGGTVIIPLEFPDGGSFDLSIEVHPWGWGENGGAIIE